MGHAHVWLKPLKILFPRTQSPMILNRGMHHWGLKLYKVCINGSSILLQGQIWSPMLLKRETFDLRVLSVPALGLYACIIYNYEHLFSNILLNFFSETAWPMGIGRGHEFIKMVLSHDQVGYNAHMRTYQNTRSRCQVSVYRTIGPLVSFIFHSLII